MKCSVLLIGAGQIGSRHLQGLARCPLPLDIHVSDPSAESLARAKARWSESAGGAGPHTVHFGEGLAGVPSRIDLAIVATGAAGRASLIERTSRSVEVHSWVLEKVLAQGEEELNRLVAALGDNDRAWVNVPRRMMAWHGALKSSTPQRSPTLATVMGGDWGLACNAVHFLDFLAWWTGEELVELRTDQLDTRWHESKRAGYWEINGTLAARYSSGSELALTCHAGPAPAVITLNGLETYWVIRESEKRADRSDGFTLPGAIEFQSELSGRVAAEILQAGRCALPTLPESVALHRVFLRAMLAHWDLHTGNCHSNVPIT